MIFAKVDVILPRHPRLLKIDKRRRAAALGVWLVALLYTREAELDGFVPSDALAEIDLGGHVSDLLRVGLLVPETRDGVEGVALYRYGVKNETKKDIDKRREEERQRKQAYRSVRKNGVPAGQSSPESEEKCPAGTADRVPLGQTRDTPSGVVVLLRPQSDQVHNEGVPMGHPRDTVDGSSLSRVESHGCPGSGSGSGSETSNGGENSPRGRARVAGGVPPDAPSGTWSTPPATIEITETIRMRCFEAGAPEPTHAHVAAYLANAREKGKMAVDWSAGFEGWMLREKKIRASVKRAPAPGLIDHEQRLKERLAELPDPVVTRVLAAKARAEGGGSK